MRLSHFRRFKKVVLILMSFIFYWCLFGDPIKTTNVIFYTSIPWSERMDRKLMYFDKYEPVNRPKFKDDDLSIPFDAEAFENLVEVPTAKCKKMVAMGGTWSCEHCFNCAKDGHKFVCLDEDVAPSSSDCLIYSFGVGEEMTFDRAMNRFNCSVYAFDMTLVNKSSALLDPKFHLVLVGLENHDVDVMFSMHDEKTPEKITTIPASFRTMDSIRKTLDHEDKVIDYLKMDIEFNEWKIFEHIFHSEETLQVLDYVKQIGLEIHFDDFKNASSLERVVGARRYEKVLTTLKSYGFHMVHTELNMFSPVFGEVRGKVFPLFRESLFIRRPG